MNKKGVLMVMVVLILIGTANAILLYHNEPPLSLLPPLQSPRSSNSYPGGASNAPSATTSAVQIVMSLPTVPSSLQVVQKPTPPDYLQVVQNSTAPDYQKATRAIALSIISASVSNPNPAAMQALYRKSLPSLQAIMKAHPGYFYAHYLADLLLMATGNDTSAYTALQETLRLPIDTHDPCPDPSVSQGRLSLDLDCQIALAFLARRRGQTDAFREHLVAGLKMIPTLERSPGYELWLRDKMLAATGQFYLGMSTPGHPATPPAGRLQAALAALGISPTKGDDRLSQLKTLQTMVSRLQGALLEYTPWFPFWRPLAIGMLSLLEGDVAMQNGDRTTAVAAWKRAADVCPYLQSDVRRRLR